MFGIDNAILGAVAGGLLGGFGGGNEQTQTRSMDPRMDRYVYGDDGKGGLLGSAYDLMIQQLASGGLNPLQQRGLDMQVQYLQSPQYANSYNSMASLGQSLMNGGVAGNPFRTVRQSVGAGGSYVPYQASDTTSPRSFPRVKLTGPTEKQPTAPDYSYGGTGSGGGGYAGQYGGGGYSTAPGGQGISNDATSAALKSMAIGNNPAVRVLSPTLAALLGFGGASVAGRQADAMGEAGDKLAASQSLANLGIGTIADADGNVRTYSSPQTIAAADALNFGPDAAATRRAYLSRGGSGGSYDRGGVFGRNNMAGDASGMGFGGDGGFGGYGAA